MNPVRSSSRRVAPLLLVCAVAASSLLTSCGSVGSGWAAKVNGTEISTSSLMADLQAEADAAKTSKGTPSTVDFKGAGQGTYTSTATSSKLSSRIIDELITQDLAHRKITVTAADQKAARRGICNTTEDQNNPDSGLTPEQIKTPCLDAYPLAFQKYQIALLAKEQAFAKAEYGIAAKAAYAQILAKQPSQLANFMCLDAAQGADQASATAIKTAIQGGATVAAAAAAANGASQQLCRLESSLPADFAGAKVGQVIGPIDTGQGFVVAQVISIKPRASFADVEAQLISALQQQDQSAQQAGSAGTVDRALIRLSKAAHVEVDPKFGTWNPLIYAVVPPKPPKGLTSTTTTTAPALTGTPTTTGR